MIEIAKLNTVLNYFFLLFLGLLSANAYSQPFQQVLASKTAFQTFCGLPLSDKYGEVSAVKVVYELKTRKVYFLNAKHFKYHYQFCQGPLDYADNVDYFNACNYSEGKERRYLLGTVNYFKALGIYALEISSADVMNAIHIKTLCRAVSKTTFIGPGLHLLLNSARLQQQQHALEQFIPTLSPAKVYGHLNYQAVSKHSGYGILKFVDNLELEKNNLQPSDIIVINQSPLFLPKVAGIIVTEFQTPLSHLTILGQNRRIPIAACKNAFQNQQLRSLAAKKVLFTVTGDTFRIKQANFETKTAGPVKEIKLDYDLSADSLIEVKQLTARSYKYAGNKACNFGMLYQLSKKGGFKTPESAFVVPFYFYKAHVNNCKAGRMIESLLSDKALLAKKDSVKVRLKYIRKEIENTPVDPVLLQKIQTKITSLGKYARMRFRSSTNAEDAPGFSGAGLYTSKTGSLKDAEKPVDKALKDVWASLWSYEAFAERNYFNLNQREVYMGVLVHRSFPEEAVNGVAITKNLYRGDIGGFVVNAQLGDKSVVNPDANVICDQFICYPTSYNRIYAHKQTVDIITLSNLNNNKLVMTAAEIQHLANQLDEIKRYFYGQMLTKRAYDDFGLDLEFKLQGATRQLYIKQVRYYND